MTDEEAHAEMRRQANRLHHLSMLYVGGICELAEGKRLGLIPNTRAGLKATRDVLDLMLFVRAEVSGLTRILIEKKIITEAELRVVLSEEYKFMADAKAEQFGVKSEDDGLVFGGD